MIMRKLLLALFLGTVGGCTTLSDTYPVVRISTRLGDLYVWLYEETPVHRQYFLDLTNSGYFDDYSFNRVIEGFVAQGGCPDTASTGLT